MDVIIKGSPKEIAALVAALHGPTQTAPPLSIKLAGSLAELGERLKPQDGSEAKDDTT